MQVSGLETVADPQLLRRGGRLTQRYGVIPPPHPLPPGHSCRDLRKHRSFTSSSTRFKRLLPLVKAVIPVHWPAVRCPLPAACCLLPLAVAAARWPLLRARVARTGVPLVAVAVAVAVRACGRWPWAWPSSAVRVAVRAPMWPLWRPWATGLAVAVRVAVGRPVATVGGRWPLRVWPWPSGVAARVCPMGSFGRNSRIRWAIPLSPNQFDAPNFLRNCEKSTPLIAPELSVRFN